jgi:hypothetical protein
VEAPLADDLFRLGHHDSTGRPRMHQQVAGLGLAAALLGELCLAGHITVHSGHVAVVDRSPPADALAHTVLDQLVGEAQVRQLRAWLPYLARDAHEQVAQRLVRAGHMRPVRGRWSRRIWYEPVDSTVAVWPEVRLRYTLHGHRQWDYSDMVLAGLVAATGLSEQILWGFRGDMRRWFLSLTDWLPAPLAELVAHTEAAVGNAVLTHRT